MGAAWLIQPADPLAPLKASRLDLTEAPTPRPPNRPTPEHSTVAEPHVRLAGHGEVAAGRRLAQPPSANCAEQVPGNGACRGCGERGACAVHLFLLRPAVAAPMFGPDSVGQG